MEAAGVRLEGGGEAFVGPWRRVAGNSSDARCRYIVRRQRQLNNGKRCASSRAPCFVTNSVVPCNPYICDHANSLPGLEIGWTHISKVGTSIPSSIALWKSASIPSHRACTFLCNCPSSLNPSVARSPPSSRNDVKRLVLAMPPLKAAQRSLVRPSRAYLDPEQSTPPHPHLTAHAFDRASPMYRSDRHAASVTEPMAAFQQAPRRPWR